MGALATTLLIIGILMLVEGVMGIIFAKTSLRLFRRFVKSMEKHLKAWSVGEAIIAIILIVLGLIL